MCHHVPLSFAFHLPQERIQLGCIVGLLRSSNDTVYLLPIAEEDKGRRAAHLVLRGIFRVIVNAEARQAHDAE